MTKKMNFRAILFIAVFMLFTGSLLCQTPAGNRHNEITEQDLTSHTLQNFNREDLGFDETTGIYRISNPADLLPKSGGRQIPKNLPKGNDLFGFTTPIPPSGTGTQTDPFLIENLGNLRWLSEEGYEAGAWANKHFQQTTDIDATETAGWNEGWGFLPIGSYDVRFIGNYDGQEHSISNITIDIPHIGGFEQIETGLFGFAEYSVLKNIRLENANISGFTTVGGIIGSAEYSSVDNCFISGIITSKGNTMFSANAGGIAGSVDNTVIINSYSTAEIISFTSLLTLFNAVGGIVGGAWRSTIENCVSTGDVSDSDYAGYVGGIVGYLYTATVKNCISSGDISASGDEVNYAGGIGGITSMNSNIIYSFSSGNVTAKSKAIYYFKNAGAGGISGLLSYNSSIQYCFSEGFVEVSSSDTERIQAGGIAGIIDNSTILYSYSRNTISSALKAGGIAGNVIESSHISNSYFYGEIIEGDFIQSGGIAGEASITSTIQNCYATTSGEFYAHGLVGTLGNGTSISYSFWDIDTTGIGTAFGVNNGIATNCVGYTTIEMKLQEFYTGWDFEDIWNINPSINNGYPFLRGLPIPVVLLPVVNLSADVDGNVVLLKWEAPEFGMENGQWRMENDNHTYPPASTEASSGTTWVALISTLIGYEVYRDNVLLTSAPINALTFTDSDVENGVYIYGVVVVYEEGRSEVVEIEVLVDTLSLPNPVVLLSPENEVFDVELRPVFRWELPVDGGEIAGLKFYIESEHTVPPLLRDCFGGNSSKKPRNDDDGDNNTILPPDTTEYTLEIDLDYETTYQWQVIAFNEFGDSVDNQAFIFTTIKYSSDKDENTLPLKTELLGNFPNPFNPETTISFTVGNAFIRSESVHVSIDIYNIRGQRVKRLLEGFYESGSHTVVWDGKEDNGREQGSGVYLYRLVAGDFVDTRRMVLLK
ncbi:MAG: T9SS type A sorting domain-containing protein [Candidatus Cloacimonetes bacterium]|nr:T9SS type A sorting domain-containing protein [Candidatus Cloacimonadota bacterium]